MGGEVASVDWGAGECWSRGVGYDAGESGLGNGGTRPR